VEGAFEWESSFGRRCRGLYLPVDPGRLFGESAGRALEAFPGFAVVVVNLPQQRWPLHEQQFLQAWAAKPIEPMAGSLIYWP
jgi:hypothetical protein